MKAQPITHAIDLGARFAGAEHPVFPKVDTKEHLKMAGSYFLAGWKAT